MISSSVPPLERRLWCLLWRNGRNLNEAPRAVGEMNATSSTVFEATTYKRFICEQFGQHVDIRYVDTVHVITPWYHRERFYHVGRLA